MAYKSIERSICSANCCGVLATTTCPTALILSRIAGSWIAVYAPPRLPAAIANRFHAYIAETMNEPAMRDKIAAVGQVVVANTPQQFAEQIERSIDLYAKLARLANLKPE